MTKKSVAYNPIIEYDPIIKRWNVPSNTHQGHRYAVRFDPCSEALDCTCVWARGMMKKTGKKCIHIKKVEEWLSKIPRSQREKYVI